MKLEVKVLCHICTERDPDNDHYMDYDGPLYANVRRKTQSQLYKCKDCENSVTVIISIHND